MDNDSFTEPRLGFSLKKPATWRFVPSPWSPAQQLHPTLDRDAEWDLFANKPFCGALKPPLNPRHALATLQVSARPMAPPSAAEAASLLESVRGILRNQNPTAEILEASAQDLVAGCRANLLKCRFSLRVEHEGVTATVGVISRSYVIFAPRYAFTLGLSSSDDPAFYEEAEFARIISSLQLQ